MLVQLVIAAITTEPCRSLCSAPSSVRFTWLRRAGGASVATATLPPSSSQRRAFGVAGGATGEVAFMSVGSASRKFFFTSRSGTRSCGRRGPARLGTTVARSSASVSENSGSGAPGV